MRSRKRPIRHDQWRYRDRWRIEAAFCGLKNVRRMGTRYDKLAADFVPAVSVRPFRPADAPACADIFDRSWHAGHPYAPRHIDLAAFERAVENRSVIVVEADGIVLGFAAVHLPERFVHHLYVEPTAFGRGIGRALLDGAVRLAGGPATLKCQTRNGRAMAFYLRAGWIGGETGEEADTGPWQRMHSPPNP